MASIEAAALALALLAASKDATGGAAWDRLAHLHYTSRLDQGERVTKRDSWVDLRGGRYLTVEPRPGGEAREGFDGKLAWRVGRGMLALEPDQRKARAAAFMKAHGYYFPDRWSFEAVLLGTRTLEGRAVDALRLTPEGGLAVELQLDRATHQPFAERYGEQLVVYEDYREAAGVWLPRRARAWAPGVAPLAAVTERVAAEVAADASFDIPAIGWRFSAGASSATPTRGSATVAARRGAIFEARVNGAGPFPFILDSGGYAQITPELARETGAAEASNVPAQAALAAGGLSISSMTFYVSRGLASVAPRVFGADRAAGSLGVETLLTLTVRLDPEGTIVFSAPDAPAPEGAVAIPLEFENSKPVASGVLDGVPGRFILDSGSNAEVVVFPAFARSSGLADRLPPGEPAEASYGFSLLAGKRTRARLLAIGGVTYLDVSVLLVGRDSPGAPGVAGLVGMGLLGRAPLTFDYARRKAYIERRAVSP